MRRKENRKHKDSLSLYRQTYFLKIRNIDLPLKVKRKSHTEKRKQNKRLFGMSIEERGDEVNKRTAFGHCEIDTVVGKKGIIIGAAFARRKADTQATSCKNTVLKQ